MFAKNPVFTDDIQNIVNDIVQSLISRTDNVCYMYFDHTYISEHTEVTSIQMKNSEETVKIFLYMMHSLYNSVICPVLGIFVFFHNNLLHAEDHYINAK